MRIPKFNLILSKWFVTSRAIVFLCALLSAFAWAGSEEGIQLRRFVHALVEASGEATSEAQSEKMRAAIARNPEVIEWAVEGKSLDALLEDADLEMAKSVLGSDGAVKDFFKGQLAGFYQESFQPEMFDRAWQAIQKARAKGVSDAFGALTLKQQVDLLGEGAYEQFSKDLSRSAGEGSLAEKLRLYAGDRPELTRWLEETMKEVGAKNPGSLSEVNSTASKAYRSWHGGQKKFAEYFKGLTYEERMALLELPGDAPYQKISVSLNRGLAEAQLADSPALQLLMDPEKGISIEGLPKDVAESFKKKLGMYFDRLAPARKRKILLAILALPPNAGVTKQLSAVVQNSGPAIQKLFQLIGDDSKSEMVLSVLRELKANVLPVPPEQVRAIIEMEYGKRLEEVFKEFDFKPLATATVGQAHRAKLIGSDDWIVVKVLKPGIEEAARSEIEDTLKPIFNETEFERRTVQTMEAGLLEELYFRNEARNLEYAKMYIDEEKGVSFATRVESTPISKRVLVLKMAQGTLMSKSLEAIDPLIRGQAIANLLDLYYRNGVFRSGRFHTDFHAGNRFLKVYEQAVRNPQGKPLPQFLITGIDAGAFGSMTIEERRGFMELFLAIQSQSPKNTMQALAAVGEFTLGNRAELETGVQAILSKKLPLEQKLNEIGTMVTKKGWVAKRGILDFNRGRMSLEKSLTQVNAELEAKGVKTRFNPTRIYLKATLDELRTGMVSKAAGKLGLARAMAEVREPIITTELLAKTLAANKDRVVNYFKKSACDTGEALLATLRMLLHPR